MLDRGLCAQACHEGHDHPANPRCTSPIGACASARVCRTWWTARPPLKRCHARPLSGTTWLPHGTQCPMRCSGAVGNRMVDYRSGANGGSACGHARRHQRQETAVVSSPAQYHREACTGLCEWHGQTFAPRCPPADLCVRLVREVNGGGIGEGQHRGGAVCGGRVPGGDRVGEIRRGEPRLLRADRDILCV